MAKPKSKENPFAFIRRVLGSTAPNTTVELKVVQTKADEGVLDRVASLNLAMAEQLAPLAMQTQDPDLVHAVLGASREARACVEARKEVTGGGLGGGTQVETQSDQGVVMRVQHHGPEGQWKSDDFHAESNGPSIPVQTGPSPAKQ
jgi:hypothetical protein